MLPMWSHPVKLSTVGAWREARGLPADPLKALAESGYVERASAERGSRSSAVSSYA